MWDYTDKVKEHFLNPRNVGEIENPDGIGRGRIARLRRRSEADL